MSDRSRRDVLFAATALAVGMTATGSRATASTSASKASFPPVVHHVFFWLKNPDSSEDLAKLLAGLRTLAGIDTVRGIHIGVPADTEQRGVVDGSYRDRKSTRLNSSHVKISYAVFCLKKK